MAGGSGGTLFDQAVLSLILTNATAGLVGIGDAAGLQPSALAGGLFLSLHSATPGKGGTQSTNELGYTGYARVSIPRSPTSWYVTSGGAAFPGTGWNLTALQWPTVTGDLVTATHIGIGTTAAGTGYLLLIAPLTASFVLTANFIPLLPSAALLLFAD